MRDVLDLRIEELRRSSSGRSEIVYHPGRLQPYTVWYRGLVYGFFANEEAALGCDPSDGKRA